MNRLDKIRERIAEAILPTAKRREKPYSSSKGYKSTISLPSGNELQMSLRGTVFACLQLRANALSSVKFNAYKEKSFSKDELSNDHWTNKLIKNPNPFFTHSQLWTFIENWLSINGNCFIWTPTLGHDVPLQMWVLNPTRTRVLLGGDNFVQGYIYQSVNDGNITIPENEVIHLAKVHPSYKPDEIIGMNVFGTGLVTAALDYANIDVEVSEYLHRFFSNNAVPPLIATHQDQVDAEVWEKLKSKWNEELPDYKLRALLGGGIGLQLPPKSDLGISYDSVSKESRSQISQIFGVPSGMLTGEYQNRATAEIQFAIFRQNTIDPEALYIAEEFTRHFKRFEDDIVIESEPYVYVDKETEMKREEFELKWGIKTINDSRKERGYNEIKDGNIPLISNGFVPLDTISTQVPLINNTNLASRNLDFEPYRLEVNKFPLETAEAKDIFWRNFDNLTEKNGINIKKVVHDIVKNLETKVTRQVDSGQLEIAGYNLSPQQISEFKQTIQESCTKAVDLVVTELGINKTDLGGQVTNQINQFANESIIILTESHEKMVQELKDVIINNASESKDNLKKIIKSKFEMLSNSRVNTIAQTTSSNVTSGMQYSVYKSQNLKMSWLSMRDKNVRPDHRAADGQLQDANGYFTVGGEKTIRPLGPGLSSKNVVNCRCQIFPIR